MKFLETPPQFVFFTGKGAVGKTSVACAAALHLAGRAKRVLLVSTDPASNVGQVLGVTIGNTITPVDQVPGLSALEINPGQAAEAYRERIIAPVRGLRRLRGSGGPGASSVSPAWPPAGGSADAARVMPVTIPSAARLGGIKEPR
jgi:anion-transporting  ArsA/GET3 family ATPase